MLTLMGENVVDQFLAAVETAAFDPSEAGHLFSDEVVFDATVPNWRYTRSSAAAVAAELAGWFRDPGTFESVERTPLPDGELVELVLTWEEAGMPHACHQVHILRVADGRIVADTAFCGGRWPAALLAEMGEAARAGPASP